MPTKAELMQALQMCHDIMDDAGVPAGDLVERANTLTRKCAMPDGIDPMSTQATFQDIETAKALLAAIPAVVFGEGGNG